MWQAALDPSSCGFGGRTAGGSGHGDDDDPDESPVEPVSAAVFAAAPCSWGTGPCGTCTWHVEG